MVDQLSGGEPDASSQASLHSCRDAQAGGGLWLAPLPGQMCWLCVIPACVAYEGQLDQFPSPFDLVPLRCRAQVRLLQRRALAHLAACLHGLLSSRRQPRQGCSR